MRIESKSIFAIVLVVMTLSLSSVPLLSAQQVTGIFSDADRSGMFPPRVAPGSIFLIGGFGLGPGVNASSSPLPYELGGTSVQVIVGERRVDAPMLFVSENWVRAILPAETPEGTAFVVLRRNGRESYPRDILVVRRELRLYGRSGWAMLAHNITPTGEWQANAYAQPARPGQLVAVWGTGLGVQQEVSSVEVLVGDKSVPALYAGPATCCVGMDVVVFEVPAGIEGCHVPVKMKFVTDGSETNSPLLAIASGEGACSDPHGLPTSLLEKFESTGILDTGIIAGTARDPGLVPTPEQESGKVGSGWFGGIFWRGGGTAATLPPMGTCQGEPGTIGPVTTIPSWVPPSDAGPGLNLRGPLELYFRRRVADRSGFVDYLTTDAPDRLESGGYVLDNGEGGARIGPFQTTFTLQDASFEWTNRQSFNVAAIASGVPITWSGGDPAGGYVVVSARISRQIEDWVVGQLDLRSLICVEKVEKQSFTIPQSLLASVPAAADLLTVHVAHVFYHRFPAPGLDFAEFHYSFGSTAAIPLR